VGSIPIGRANFDGPMNWVIGKSGFEPQAGSNPVQPGNWLTTQLASCPSSIGAGPLCFGYRTGSSTEKEQPARAGRHGFDSRPETSKPFLVRPLMHTFIGPKVVGYLTQ